MTLSEIEDELYMIYQFWASKAPGVTPKEEGRLGDLWRAFDQGVQA